MNGRVFPIRKLRSSDEISLVTKREWLRSVTWCQVQHCVAKLPPLVMRKCIKTANAETCSRHSCVGISPVVG